ncbi:MAG: Holliday junction resolvase Hjc [Candidatus Nanoarchaeia archaeon]
MSRKSKGIDAERELIHRFWNTESWVAHRIAGSGSSKYPSPDIIASNNIRKISIECKTTKGNTIYIAKKEISELKKFGEMFGAECWVGIKFYRQDWLFLTLDDLRETNSNYSITLDDAKSRGLVFEEIII